MLNLITLCDVRSKQSILDVGCGPGLSTRLVALDMKKGLFYYKYRCYLLRS